MDVDDGAAGAVNPAERRFAAVMRETREARGLAQGRFAGEMVRCGFPAWVQQTVTRVEAGRRMIRLSEAMAAASILGIDLGAFAAGNPVPRQACVNCSDGPPAGFTCNACGRSGQ
jgi:transcriptional regulator with XRE-family HTH domain